MSMFIHRELPAKFARTIHLSESFYWTSLRCVPLTDGAVSDDITLDLLHPSMDGQSLPTWTITPYSAGPPVVLPFAEVEPASCTNSGEGAVLVHSIAVVGHNPSTGKDDVLLWAELPQNVTVQSTEQYQPPKLRLHQLELADALPEAPTGTLVFAIVYETGSHVDCAKLTDGQPGLLQYGDLTAELRAEWLWANRAMELLLYALCGSQCVYAHDAEPFVHWKKRYHPRCHWFPEQNEPHWCESEEVPPNCEQKYSQMREYVARGQSIQVPVPHVPLRSHSGDPKLQYIDHDKSREHDRIHFPVGSVSRSGDQVGPNGSTYDPLGHGFFGGDPTRLQADPPTNVTQQYSWEQEIAGDAVVATCTPSVADGETITAMTLHYNGHTVTMTASGGTWSGTIPAQDHGVGVDWYLEATILPNSGPAFVRYEPGGNSAPESGKAYTYVAFTHWNPYANGLPELDATCRKGTDWYSFESGEKIQFEHLNMFRFALDYLGDILSHSPYVRDEIPGCCHEFPIRWHWMGSARRPFYIRGGKGGLKTDGITHYARSSPLHNNDHDGEAAGSIAARRSWSGIGLTDAHDNREYGGDETWLSPPFEVFLENWTVAKPGKCDVYFHGERRGLHAGDVIAPEHFYELIDGLIYLIDKGAWVQAPIHTRPMNPPEGECTDPEYQCVDNDNNPFPVPSNWSNCYKSAAEGSDLPDRTRDATCNRSFQHDISTSCYRPTSEILYSYDTTATKCSASFAANLVCQGVGARLTGSSYYEWQEQFAVFNGVSFASCGYFAYICTPPRSVNGPDDLHGNGLTKYRETHTCPPAYPEAIPYQSYGNGLAFAYTCGNVYSVSDDKHRMELESVVPVPMALNTGGWPGWTGDFGNPCSLKCWNIDDLPELPGYPGNHDRTNDGTRICSATCTQDFDYNESTYNILGNMGCSLSAPSICSGNLTWAAIDLNIDGDRPFGFIAGQPNLPQLKEYSVLPVGVQTPNCPCDTLGEGACAE